LEGSGTSAVAGIPASVAVHDVPVVFDAAFEPLFPVFRSPCYSLSSYCDSVLAVFVIHPFAGILLLLTFLLLLVFPPLFVSLLLLASLLYLLSFLL
jgi:hypothetical protein